MQLIIKPYPLLLFTLTFILFVPIGTLSHEGGHIAVAKMLDYDTELHYGSMNWDKQEMRDIQIAFYEKYAHEIKNDLPFPEKETYQGYFTKWGSDSFKVTLGGPFQTILTSLLGLFILFIRKKRRNINGFKLIDWLAVFLSLFWLRTTFNVTYSGIRSLWKGGSIFSGTSDETRIAAYLDMPSWTFSLIFGGMGLAIALYIVFILVPKDKRLTFILAGLIGGISGYLLWLEILGPIIMP